VLKGLIATKYKQVYDQLRTVFGLKFNYSVRLVKDKSQPNGQKIQLIKRCPKKWFKSAK